MQQSFGRALHEDPRRRLAGEAAADEAMVVQAA